MKINCILLAAGNSKRFNSNKLLKDLKGKFLVEYTLDKVAKLDVADKIIITQNEKVADIALNYDLTALHNPNPDKGLSYSIELGINATEDADGYIFVVCDQPLLSLDSIKRIIATFMEHNGEKIVCAGFGDDLGNPAIFPAGYKQDLLDLEGDSGGRSVYKDHMDNVIVCPVSNGLELFDIDTVEQFDWINDQVLGKLSLANN